MDIISSGHSLKFFRKIVKIERVTLRVVILDENQIYFVWKGNPEARLLYTCETKMAARTNKWSIFTILRKCRDAVSV